MGALRDMGDGWWHTTSADLDLEAHELTAAFRSDMLKRVGDWMGDGLLRGRTEWGDDYLLAALFVPVMDPQTNSEDVKPSAVWSRTILVLATRDAVLTVDSSPEDRPDVDPSVVGNRFRATSDRRPGRLVTLILDAVATAFVAIVDRFEEEANAIEELLDDDSPHSRLGGNYLRERLKTFRGDLYKVRRAMLPTMEAVRQIVSGTDLAGAELFPDDLERRLRDTLDKLLYTSESFEGIRDEASSLRDYHQTRIANEQNEVMKTLTIVAALVLVPTFIVGFFGQNFIDMPGLHDGFWVAVILMAVIVLLEVVFLWWRGWIGDRGNSKVEHAARAALALAASPIHSVTDRRR